MVITKKIVTIYISNEFNYSDAEKIGIIEGDLSQFLIRLSEYREDLQNACIVTSSFDILFNMLSAADVFYKTDDAYDNGTVMYITDEKAFGMICKEDRTANVYESWITCIRLLSEDIDILEERYNDQECGEFLRSALIYFTQFDIVTKLKR